MYYAFAASTFSFMFCFFLFALRDSKRLVGVIDIKRVDIFFGQLRSCVHHSRPSLRS